MNQNSYRQLNHCRDSYRTFAKALNSAITRNQQSFLCYSPSAVSRRLSQKVVGALELSFSEAHAFWWNTKPDPTKQFTPDAVCDAGLRISKDGSSLNIEITRRLVFYHIAAFLFFWTKILLAIAKGASDNCANNSSVAIFANIGQINYLRNNSTDSIKRFFKVGPIPPLREKTLIILEAIKGDSGASDCSIIFDPDPILKLTRLSNLAWSLRFRILLDQLGAFFYFIYKCFFVDRLFCLLAKDIAFHSLVKQLNASGLMGDLYLTNSNVYDQPLYSCDLPNRAFSINLIYYSVPVYGHRYNFEHHQAKSGSLYFLSKVDTIWCWTRGQADQLEALFPGTKIIPVGPIIWHVPTCSSRVEISNSSTFSLLVFDVVPVDAAQQKTLTGGAHKFYDLATVSRFLYDIIDVCDTLPENITIYLKTKRPPYSIFDRSKRAPPSRSEHYYSLTQNLFRTGRLRPLSHDANLFDEIQATDIVVSFPFTSTAFVAASIGVPSIYYDPTCLLQNVTPLEKTMLFIQGKKELARTLKQTLKQSKINQTKNSTHT
jgi:polysaccharide biosynthesis PFTS motif protein